jgi:riboflavin synthase
MGSWEPGRGINVERALALGEELGGHIVTGHVDGVAKVVSRFPDGESVRFLLEVPVEFAKFIASKGSIALNGVSLTVNEVEGPRFDVNIIPYTLSHTSWGQRQPGDLVNLEVDLLARYAARLSEVEGVHS